MAENLTAPITKDLKCIINTLISLKRRGFHGKIEINAIDGKYNDSLKVTEIIKAGTNN